MTTPSRIYGISPLSQAAIGGDLTSSISAAGTTQATATALTTDNNYVSTCAAGAGVILPVGEQGKSVFVANNGAGAMLVYPPVGGTMNKLAVNLPATLQPGTSGYYNYSGTLTTYYVSTAPMPITQQTIITAGSSQLTAAQTVGAQANYIVLTVQGAATFATPNAATIWTTVPNATTGLTFITHFCNQNSGTATLSGGTGVTLTGTLAVQTAASRSYVVSLDTATTVTFTNVSP